MDQPRTDQAASQNPSSTQPVVIPPEQVAQQVLHSHEASLFRPTTVRFDPRSINLPDSFFEPTVSELSHAAKTYAHASQSMNEPVLQTRKMRQEHAERRMNRFRKVMIRILFPDRVALQGIFTPKTTIRQVIRFVRASLRDARNVQFHLFVTPPKRILKDLDATLWAEGLVPAALIHFGGDNIPTDSSNLLKRTVLDTITDAPESQTPLPPPPPPSPAVAENDTNNSTSHESPSEKAKKARKLPKWFKASKKS